MQSQKLPFITTTRRLFNCWIVYCCFMVMTTASATQQQKQEQEQHQRHQHQQEQLSSDFHMMRHRRLGKQRLDVPLPLVTELPTAAPTTTKRTTTPTHRGTTAVVHTTTRSPTTTPTSTPTMLERSTSAPSGKPVTTAPTASPSSAASVVPSTTRTTAAAPTLAVTTMATTTMTTTTIMPSLIPTRSVEDHVPTTTIPVAPVQLSWTSISTSTTTANTWGSISNVTATTINDTDIWQALRALEDFLFVHLVLDFRSLMQIELHAVANNTSTAVMADGNNNVRRHRWRQRHRHLEQSQATVTFQGLAHFVQDGKIPTETILYEQQSAALYQDVATLQGTLKPLGIALIDAIVILPEADVTNGTNTNHTPTDSNSSNSNAVSNNDSNNDTNRDSNSGMVIGILIALIAVAVAVMTYLWIMTQGRCCYNHKRHRSANTSSILDESGLDIPPPPSSPNPIGKIRNPHVMANTSPSLSEFTSTSVPATMNTTITTTMAKTTSAVFMEDPSSSSSPPNSRPRCIPPNSTNSNGNVVVAAEDEGDDQSSCSSFTRLMKENGKRRCVSHQDNNSCTDDDESTMDGYSLSGSAYAWKTPTMTTTPNNIHNSHSRVVTSSPAEQQWRSTNTKQERQKPIRGGASDSEYYSDSESQFTFDRIGNSTIMTITPDSISGVAAKSALGPADHDHDEDVDDESCLLDDDDGVEAGIEVALQPPSNTIAATTTTTTTTASILWHQQGNQSIPLTLSRPSSWNRAAGPDDEPHDSDVTVDDDDDDPLRVVVYSPLATEAMSGNNSNTDNNNNSVVTAKQTTKSPTAWSRPGTNPTMTTPMPRFYTPTTTITLPAVVSAVDTSTATDNDSVMPFDEAMDHILQTSLVLAVDDEDEDRLEQDLNDFAAELEQAQGAARFVTQSPPPPAANATAAPALILSSSSSSTCASESSTTSSSPTMSSYSNDTVNASYNSSNKNNNKRLTTVAEPATTTIAKTSVTTTTTTTPLAEYLRARRRAQRVLQNNSHHNV